MPDLQYKSGAMARSGTPIVMILSMIWKVGYEIGIQPNLPINVGASGKVKIFIESGSILNSLFG